MPLRECPPGAGFEVPLKSQCRRFVSELDRYNEGPRPPKTGVSREPGVVPVQSPVYVAARANVMPARIDVAPHHIHEPLADVPHRSDAWHVLDQPKSLG